MESFEFKQWLKRHHNLLRSYTPDQIAYFARMNGFPLEIVCADVTNHVVHLKRLMNFWESPLNTKWLELVNYDHGHDSEGV